MTLVYRLFDEYDDLIYVGVTDNSNRVKDHRRNQPWGNQIHRSTTVSYETREEALIAERHAIYTEKPRYNKQHSRPPGLVGQAFYSSALRRWKGVVLDHVMDDVFLLELDNWVHGLPNMARILIRLEEMMDWQFFSCREDRDACVPPFQLP